MILLEQKGKITGIHASEGVNNRVMVILDTKDGELRFYVTDKTAYAVRIGAVVTVTYGY